MKISCRFNKKRGNRMNKYEEMIQKFANDFELELNNPDEFSISDLIKYDKTIANDIYLLSKLAYLIRNDKAKVIVEDEWA
nr:MAG TPA: hypothetical protein [Caudoviricetes sp.]